MACASPPDPDTAHRCRLIDAPPTRSAHDNFAASCWSVQDRDRPLRFVLHDRDAKFPPTFDTIFTSAGMEVIRTPSRAPNANAYAERWVRAVREECLDHLLVVNEAHLRRVLADSATYFNRARPHQGLDQRIPLAPVPGPQTGPVLCRDALGGLRHDYYRDAA